MQGNHNARDEFRTGLKKSLPVMLGVVPFGVAYGILAVQSLTIGETLLMSVVVFAGASQFMAAGMFASGVGGITIVLSTLLINVRHLVMGLSLSPYLSETSPWWQRLVAFGMVDESYMISITHYREQGRPQGSPHFLLASGLSLYVLWFLATLVGAVAGASISDPLKWGLDFAMPATFLTMLLPQVVSRRQLAVVSAAAIAAVGAYVLIPGKWYIIIAVVAGVATGIILETRAERLAEGAAR
ncbi:MAG TPA: AzlC family ABC transporter permease [Coriobacteriia bacterium]|nr:AzlC family ABC transporter permease [Coriobacteriia bacterium]